MNLDLLNTETTESTSGGGYFGIRFLPFKDAKIIPVPDMNNKAITSNDFVMIDGAYGWIHFNSEEDKITFSEEAKEDGVSYDVTLAGFSSGENTNIRQFINEQTVKLKGYALFDNCEENNTKLIGKGKCCPATLIFTKFEGGEKGSDTKGWTFEIKVEGQKGVSTNYKGVGAFSQEYLVTPNDASPDVSKGTATYLLPENIGNNVITTLDNAVQGSLITLKWESTINHSTLANGTVFQLTSDFTPTNGAILVLQATSKNTFAERYRQIPT